MLEEESVEKPDKRPVPTMDTDYVLRQAYILHHYFGLVISKTLGVEDDQFCVRDERFWDIKYTAERAGQICLWFDLDDEVLLNRLIATAEKHEFAYRIYRQSHKECPDPKLKFTILVKQDS